MEISAKIRGTPICTTNDHVLQSSKFQCGIQEAFSSVSVTSMREFGDVENQPTIQILLECIRAFVEVFLEPAHRYFNL